MNTTTTERLSDVVGRQTVVPAWLQEFVEQHSADAAVIVLTKRTPFGDFLLAVALTQEAQQDEEYEALTGEQRVQYVEATRCGANRQRRDGSSRDERICHKA